MTEIVVGVDGSEHARDALRWALYEAQLRGHQLTAVLAWGLFDQLHVGADRRFDPDYGPADARAALAAVVEDAVGAEAARQIRLVSVCDLPARALLDAAADADMLVLGPRGLGPLREVVLGSVSSTCLQHAPCPIAIVRPDGSGTARPRDEMRIVVGIDGSAPSADALRWAIGEAQVRGATVEAVHAWHIPYSLSYGAVAFDVSMFEEAARHLLDEVVDAAERDAPGAKIERHLVSGPAADTLLRAAEGAGLVVVGSRGVGGFRGLLAGSVSQQVAHHATSPVVVVPSPDRVAGPDGTAGPDRTAGPRIPPGTSTRPTSAAP